ncbi:hypothetical protein GCM10009682_07770 [Luedemannella flava]|uniref:Uncharacterized protein n=1 Tax=Luedemannella flava TaxID=349316 RepID=A0ABN2LHX7_9ACTN
MAYSVQEQKPRPTVVTAAVGLLYATAGILLVLAVAGISISGSMKAAYEEAYRGTDAASSSDVVAIASTWGTAVVYILFAVGLAVLAMFVGRGKQPARITTWVVTGLVALCCGCGGILGAASGSAMDSLTQNMEAAPGQPDPTKVTKIIEAHMPSWYTPVTTVLVIIMTLTSIAVIILLALPAANPFFRKEPEVWVPPTTWPPAPGTPGAPGLPGYPGTPGADPNQPPAPPQA